MQILQFTYISLFQCHLNVNFSLLLVYNLLETFWRKNAGRCDYYCRPNCCYVVIEMFKKVRIQKDRKAAMKSC